MSVLHQLTAAEIRARYTHYGFFCGLVPVYIAHPDSEAPELCERNWVPEWWFTAVEWLFGAFCQIATTLDPEWEGPGFPIMVGDKIT